MWQQGVPDFRLNYSAEKDHVAPGCALPLYARRDALVVVIVILINVVSSNVFECFLSMERPVPFHPFSLSMIYVCRNIPYMLVLFF
jgi:hypothetical protein